MGRQIRMAVTADGMSTSRGCCRGDSIAQKEQQDGVESRLSGKPVPVTTEWMKRDLSSGGSTEADFFLVAAAAFRDAVTAVRRRRVQKQMRR